MVLTTPESAFFDQKHKEYENENENDKSFERYQDDNMVTTKDSEAVDRKYDSDTLLNDIHGNSTEERNQSTYLNQAEVESTKYDVSASEVKNRTDVNNTTVSGEKKAKFMQEGSHVNLTLPDAGEVWALASMKNVEHNRDQQGQYYNVTTQQKVPDDSNNGTLVTKQLADWASVTRNNDFTNNSFGANNFSSSMARLKDHLAEVIRNFNLSRSTVRPSLFNNTMKNNIFNNTLRGRIRYQPKPLITRDQDTASQENQIIAVRLTTLPPPIVLRNNYSYTTPPLKSDSQNRIDFQHTDESTPSVTDMITEMVTTTEDDEMEMTTTQSVDNSQNELKTRFRIKNLTATTTNRPVETEFDTTTDLTLQFTTETDEQKTPPFNVDDMLPTTQVYETTTLLTTTEPTDFHHTTTEQEFPTTNPVNLETESITEIDEEEDEQTTITAGHQPISTENEILESQSSTLLPQYVEIEKTTEMKNPSTEAVHTTTTELQEPTTEFIARKDSKQIDSIPQPSVDNKPDATTTIINLNRDEYKYSTFKNRSDETTPSVDVIPDEVETSSPPTPANNSQVPDIGEYSLDGPDTNAIIAISISVVAVVVIGAVLAVLFVLRKRKKQLTYGQRCRPVGLDAYSLDNVSVYNSVRRKGMLRMSKRSYGNAAFDDPGLKNNLLTGAALVAFAQKKNEIYEEFKELPAVTARAEEVPAGCEDKNR